MPKDIAPLGEFSDLGKIAAQSFNMKADNQGMAITKFGRKSPRGLARIIVSLPFVYYRDALSKLQKKGKLPSDLADLQLIDIMEEIDPDYAG